MIHPTKGLQGLVVCVQYDDILALTLPFTVRHFDKIVVVTASFDVNTQATISRYGMIEPHITDVFYEDGAVFNKGAAVEEAITKLDPEKWTVIFDADIIMPRDLNLRDLDADTLYGPHRWNVPNKPAYYAAIATPNFNLTGLVKMGDKEFPGYFQLFHPGAAALKERPWYSTHWKHAGGCDSDFQAKFAKRVRLDFPVLHLGMVHTNWHGRATPRWDGKSGAPGRIGPEDAQRLHRDMLNKRREYRGVSPLEFLGS